MPAAADTVESALVAAYQSNPQLNVQRAIVRQTDEQVPQALSGYRPRVSATATARHAVGSGAGILFQGLRLLTIKGTLPTASAGLTAIQTLYNGFQTANRTRAAESQVSAARATLRNTEQTVLLNALTAYMNLLRDYAALELQKRNVAVLQARVAADTRSFQTCRCDRHRRVASGKSFGRRANTGLSLHRRIMRLRSRFIGR